MAKTRKAKKLGRPALGKRTVTIRLSPAVLAQAKAIAAPRGNFSAYIEELLTKEIEGKR